ncbi:helix-turn-helix transcriptional regulator [Acidicapsa dinghuensis]|uniref:Helix-turn-helix transcriptional regulator n=1 Tax=Acidicapsa dinghuensis TaxID=2218256 RepID=A0ABW1ENI5_9BACT|nr:helix-turn-helix domain-containing protein [Acidicapsa dinghuensis]
MSNSFTYDELQEHGFTLLTNHALVLVLIARIPDIRMREIASHIGITERAVQRIIDDLTTNGYVVITKDGRRNRYEINLEHPIQHPLITHLNIGDLVRFLGPQFQT